MVSTTRSTSRAASSASCSSVTAEVMTALPCRLVRPDVTSSWGLPLVPFKLYKVDDGTGEVTVLSQGGRAPTRGAHVRVTGRVSDVATFGGSSVGLHIKETDLDFRR